MFAYNNLYFDADNVGIKFGASPDSYIYSNGDDLVINRENVAGDVIFTNFDLIALYQQEVMFIVMQAH